MVGRTKSSGCLLQVGDVLLMIGQLGIGLRGVGVSESNSDCTPMMQ